MNLLNLWLLYNSVESRRVLSVAHLEPDDHLFMHASFHLDDFTKSLRMGNGLDIT